MDSEHPLSHPPLTRRRVRVGGLRDGRVERGDRTRQRLVEAARHLFTMHGYAATGTPEIARAAGVSRGSLYHHFADKRALFAAVYEDVEREMTARVMACWEANADAPYWERMRCAVHTFLRDAADPTVRRVVMVEAPAVLGCPGWVDTASTTAYRLLREGLEGAQREGLMDPEVDVAAAAHLLFGSFTDAAQWIAGEPDDASAVGRASVVADRFLDAFRATAVARSAAGRLPAYAPATRGIPFSASSIRSAGYS
jgi:AcrR family transcriptional regulator